MVEPSLRVGHQSLLFLEQRPNGLWRILDPHAGRIGEIVQGRVQPVDAVEGAQFWQWQGETVEEADRQLQRHMQPSGGVRELDTARE
jgi:hypothetical protein